MRHIIWHRNQGNIRTGNPFHPATINHHKTEINRYKTQRRRYKSLLIYRYKTLKKSPKQKPSQTRITRPWPFALLPGSVFEEHRWERGRNSASHLPGEGMSETKGERLSWFCLLGDFFQKPLALLKGLQGDVLSDFFIVFRPLEGKSKFWLVLIYLLQSFFPFGKDSSWRFGYFGKAANHQWGKKVFGCFWNHSREHLIIYLVMCMCTIRIRSIHTFCVSLWMIQHKYHQTDI